MRFPVNFAKLLKETLAQVFSCEFCEIIEKETLAQVFSCEFCEIIKRDSGIGVFL